MTKSGRKRYERELLRERAEAQRVLASMPVDQETDFSTTDRADLATIAVGRDMDRLVNTLEADAMSEIDRALARLEFDPEAYGKCVACGAEISPDRLDVLPATQHCAAHAPDR